MSEWKPHVFYPSMMHMGDCYECGNTRENCEAINAEAEACLAIAFVARAICVAKVERT